MMRDLFSNIGSAPAIAPAVKSAAADGLTVDLKGYGSAAFIVNTGDAAFVDSNAPATLAATSTYRLGYRGNKRYVRLQLTKAGGTSIALGAVAVLGSPAMAPVA